MKTTFVEGLSIETVTPVTEAMLPILDGKPVFPVLSTSGLVGLMELTCRRLIEQHISPDIEAMGVEVSVQHLGICGVGCRVRTVAELAEFRHQRARFHVSCLDGDRLLGTGVLVHRILSRERAARAIEQGQSRPSAATARR